MIAKSEGLVVNHIRFQERSIIARIYSSEFGFGSYLVQGIRSARSKQQLAYFQPFTLLDMVVYQKPSRTIQRLTDYKALVYPIETDVRKQAVLLFLSEVFQKLLQNEQEANPRLYAFLKDSFTQYHRLPFNENFHIQCLIQMADYLGVSISSLEVLMDESARVEVDREITEFMSQAIEKPLFSSWPASGNRRSEALQWLLQYFEATVPGFGQIRSMEVLQKIFY